MVNTPIQMHTPLTSHRSSASEGSIHVVLAAKDSRWQGKCTNVSLRLWLIAESLSTLPAAGRPAVCPEGQGGGASLVGVSASFPSCFLSKPKPTHPFKDGVKCLLPFDAPLDGPHNTFSFIHSLSLPSHYLPSFPSHGIWHLCLSVITAVLISTTLTSTLRAETDLSLLVCLTATPEVSY